MEKAVAFVERRGIRLRVGAVGHIAEAEDKCSDESVVE
jgi:hypothetical protein